MRRRITPPKVVTLNEMLRPRFVDEVSNLGDIASVQPCTVSLIVEGQLRLALSCMRWWINDSQE
jgi:hypothetical protein